jgi:hypothetical protein
MADGKKVTTVGSRPLDYLGEAVKMTRLAWWHSIREEFVAVYSVRQEETGRWL